MQHVQGFVRENRHALGHNIRGLRDVTQILVKQRDALSQTLNTAPLALNNLFLTYNPSTGTLDTRSNLGENINSLHNDPALVLCSMLYQADQSGKSCDAVKKAVGGLPRSAPLGSRAQSSRAQSRPVQVEHIDKSLAGLVEEK
jgi:phospholipid/cholesterol/gamma-HCH transport system substrate-binding protein